MSPWLVLWLWIAMHGMHIALSVIAYMRQEFQRGPLEASSSGLSIAGAAVPLLSLLVFLRVFVFGGGSNVAQMADGGGEDLWELWFDFYPLMGIGTLLGGGAVLVSLCLPPYPIRHAAAFGARLCGAAAAGLAFYVLTQCPPDA